MLLLLNFFDCFSSEGRHSIVDHTWFQFLVLMVMGLFVSQSLSAGPPSKPLQPETGCTAAGDKERRTVVQEMSIYCETYRKC